MDKKKAIKRVSIDFPIFLLEKIDSICETNFMTRRKWFIDAASEKLEKERSNQIDMLVRK
jgi:metal-responsive CopG/Arc/MetJ family transcriptional regulator